MTQTSVTKLSKALLVLSTLLIIGGMHMHHHHPGGHHEEDHHQGGHMMERHGRMGRHHGGGSASHSHSLPHPGMDMQQDKPEEDRSESLPMPPQAVKSQRGPRHEGHRGPMRGGDDRRRPEGEMREKRAAHGLEHHDDRRRQQEEKPQLPDESHMNERSPAHKMQIVAHVIGCLMTLTGIVGLVAGAREAKCATTAFLVLLTITVLVSVGATVHGRHVAIHEMCSGEGHMGPKPLGPNGPRHHRAGDEQKEMNMKPEQMPPQQLEVVEIDVIEIDEVNVKDTPRAAHGLEHHDGPKHRRMSPKHGNFKAPNHECVKRVNKHAGGIAIHILAFGAILFIVAAKLRKAITIASANAVTVTGVAVVTAGDYAAVPTKDDVIVEVSCEAPIKTVE